MLEWGIRPFAVPTTTETTGKEKSGHVFMGFTEPIRVPMLRSRSDAMVFMNDYTRERYIRFLRSNVTRQKP